MKTLSGKQRSFLLDLALVLSIFCLTVVLSLRGSLHDFDCKQYDFFFRLKRAKPVQKSNVVIVCIDQKSLSYYDRQLQGWPWPREFHVRLIDILTKCGAKRIVFDIFFSESDLDRVSAASGDAELGQAVQESGRTFFIVQLMKEEKPRKVSFDEKAFLSDHDAYRGFTPKNNNYGVFPVPVISEYAAGLGFANMVPDNDGMVRRYPLVMTLNGRYVPSIALAVARSVRGKENVDTLVRRALKRHIIDREGYLLLNWYGRGDIDVVFQYCSYFGVMNAAIKEEKTGLPDSLRKKFEDKIVLVGSNAPGLFDNKATPVSKGSAYPGVEVHATAIENFLADDFIALVPRWLTLLLTAAASAALFILFRAAKSLRLFVAAYFAFIAVEMSVSWLLILRDLWLPSVGIYLVTTLVFVGLVTSGYFTETREKRLLRRYFERYVNDSVLEEILANPTAVDLKGRTILATVMATDIQDFTNISEKMHAYDVVARLNDYLSEVSEVLINHGAFINKYSGDAILALYGAFGENPYHREQACRAALAAMEVIIRKADEARVEGMAPFITRFGLNTGEMTMGNIGSARKIEYTVIGDAVNSAYRLEGINKYYGTRILVSEFTREGVGDGFEFRMVDALQFKGKDLPVRIYELIGEKGMVDTAVLRRRGEYERAFSLYAEKRFEEARAAFALLREEGDAASEVLEERCRQFMEAPPGEDWNGVWRMFTK